MKSLIREILIEQTGKETHLQRLYNSNLKNVAFSIIEKYAAGETQFDAEEMSIYVMDRLGLRYNETLFFIFTYIIENGESPTDYLTLNDWLYQTTSSSEMDFLRVSGYYDKFVDYMTVLSDLTQDDDGKIYLHMGRWLDFAHWFEQDDVAEKVFGEDWLDLFHAWDTDFEEICDNLDSESINFITDTIIYENEGELITGLGHREEFESMLDEDGDILVSGNNIQEIKNITDPYNLHVFIEDSNLDDGDLVNHIRNSYNMAYNGTAEDELFTSFKEQIESFLGSKVERTSEPDSGLKIDVTDTIEGFVETYIIESHDNPIDEYSTLEDLLSGLFYYAPKLSGVDISYYYPDHNKIKEYFNDTIRENY